MRKSCCNPDNDTECGNEGDVNNKVCDLCKTQQRVSAACHHCIQCYMYFCAACLSKHSGNPLFTSHHVINMGESNATEVLFCRTHKEHPVRYFCKPCSLMLCTICTMDHEPKHKPEPLEKGIIEKYRTELQDSLRAITSKLSEVKTKTKYLETIKEAHQKSLYEAQNAIQEKTDQIVKKIKDQEKKLLEEVQSKIDVRMRENGIDSLTEIKFYSSNIQSLYTEIESVVLGSPQQCLVAYEELIAKLKNLPDAPQVASRQRSGESSSILRFVPATDDSLKHVIGTLQECTLSDDVHTSLRHAHSSKTATAAGASPSQNRRRTILSALTPGRKNQGKRNKIKAANTPDAKSTKTSGGKINADEILRSSSEGSHSVASTSHGSKSVTIVTAALPDGAAGASLYGTALAASSTNQLSFQGTCKPKIVFKVDQIGGWPGKVTSPSSVAVLCNGYLVVAECENRIQIFDKCGQSIRIMGWGKVKPQRVAVTADGRIAITDRQDNCVKLFATDGELVGSWGAGMFEMPTGIAITSAGHYVITDVERHAVCIHRHDGSLITQFGSWGAGDYQFNNPAYVAVDKQDNIFVSDSSNNCIKVYNQNGNFLRRISITTCKQSPLRQPMGIAIANNGNILVADRDNHRISMLTPDGTFVQHILCKNDGLKYPVDVRVTDDDHVAVVETHSGFLTQNPHHAVKLYKFS